MCENKGKSESAAVNTIRISETKLKVMISRDDMEAYHLSGEGVDYSDPCTREALRALLREAGREVGFDTDRGRSFIQLYPDKSGGCELFLTLLDTLSAVDVSDAKDHGPIAGEKEGMMPAKNVTAPSQGATRHKFAVNVYEFPGLECLTSACRRIDERNRRTSACGESYAYADREGKGYYLVIYEGGKDGAFAPTELICEEYDGKKRRHSAFLYIKEHCFPICEGSAVEKLGALE